MRHKKRPGRNRKFLKLCPIAGMDIGKNLNLGSLVYLITFSLCLYKIMYISKSQYIYCVLIMDNRHNVWSLLIGECLLDIWQLFFSPFGLGFCEKILQSTKNAKKISTIGTYRYHKFIIVRKGKPGLRLNDSPDTIIVVAVVVPVTRCLTLCNPWTCTPPSPSVHGIS